MAVKISLKEPSGISGVSITNFKGIAKCSIKNVATVNLLLGKNDSGKSSIMEAIFYTFREYIGNSLGGIMSRRTDVFTGGRELWYNYDTRHPVDISVTLERGGTIGLKIAMDEERIHTTFYGSYGRKSSARSKGPWTVGGSTYLGEDFTFSVGKEKTQRIPISDSKRRGLASFASSVTFIDCRSKSVVSAAEKELAEIKIKGKTARFGRILKTCYGKSSNWEFVPHIDRPNEVRLVFREGRRIVFASDLGDGFRLGLSILSKMFNRTNTCFFIEEIESHQHIGSLKQLLKAVVEIARLNNLQVFITTHSADTWNSLSRGVYLNDTERENTEFRCFVIERDLKSGVVSAEHTEDITEIHRVLGLP